MKNLGIVAGILLIVGVGIVFYKGKDRGQQVVGVTEDEVKIGNTNPYSGPLSVNGTVGRAIKAYIHTLNEQGGIDGKRIDFISLDDGYKPDRTVAQVRRLVEKDKVFFLLQNLGTPTNSAIHEYVNQQQIPHLFLATGSSKWGQPEKYPWTMGWQPTYYTEGQVYARYILEKVENPKVAILYQDDDYGRDYINGLRAGLGEKANEVIIASEPYASTDATVEAQIVKLAQSRANVFFNVSTGKFTPQAIRKVYDIGWRPLHILNNVSTSVSQILTPAGLEKSKGIITAQYLKDPTDPQWKDDPEFIEWSQWMDTYYPQGDKKHVLNAYAYAVGASLEVLLRQLGGVWTRENLMYQAAHLSFRPPMVLPGIRVETSEEDFYPIEALQLSKFDGKRWALFGKLMDVGQ